MTLPEALDAGPVPMPFVAFTVNVYDWPEVRPDTVQVVDDVVHVDVPLLAVTVYDVIAEPPLAGADHDTAIFPVPAPVPLTLKGAPGRVIGVNEFDADDAGPVPVPFVAVTANVYAVPFVRPVTTHDVVEVVQVLPPGDAVTVYEVGDCPPFAAGAVHDTSASPDTGAMLRILLPELSAT